MVKITLLITGDHPPSALQVCRCSLQVDTLENSLQSAIRTFLSATTFAQRPFANQWGDKGIIQESYTLRRSLITTIYTVYYKILQFKFSTKNISTKHRTVSRLAPPMKSEVTTGWKKGLLRNRPWIPNFRFLRWEDCKSKTKDTIIRSKFFPDGGTTSLSTSWLSIENLR